MREWSLDDDGTLLSMDDEGKSMQEISIEIGRSVDDCKDRLDELNSDGEEEFFPIDRTSESLRNHLFNTMEKLSRGQISPAEANAMCNVSSSICHTVELEIKAEITRQSISSTAPIPTLKLGRK